MATDNLTLARLRELLHYDPASGTFRWRVRFDVWFDSSYNIANVAEAN